MSKEELINVLNEMDLPAMRRELSVRNIRWLLRNIRVRNSNHPRIAEVFEELKRLLLSCN